MCNISGPIHKLAQKRELFVQPNCLGSYNKFVWMLLACCSRNCCKCDTGAYKYERDCCKGDVQQVIKGKYGPPKKVHGKLIAKMVPLARILNRNFNFSLQSMV